MSDTMLLQRIVSDPGVLGGKPVIAGTRLSVDYILRLMGQGVTLDDLMDEYDGLNKEDIQACLLFASHVLAEAEFMPLLAESA